jgi:hypothetical protein
MLVLVVRDLLGGEDGDMEGSEAIYSSARTERELPSCPALGGNGTGIVMWWGSFPPGD